ncbi:MAG: ABC transporter permease [Paenibacillaceae bacterium]
MFTVNQLFFRRLFANWKFQYDVLRTVVDWVTALYFFIPALMIAVYQYYTWWHVTPWWMDGVSFNIIVIALSLFASTGAVRLFILDGDQLFLVQRSRYYRSLMKLGILYTFMLQFALSAAIILLLAPFLLIRYDLSLIQMIVLFLFISVYRSNFALLLQRVSNHYSGWRYVCLWLGLKLIFVTLYILLLAKWISMPLLFFVVCALLMASAVYLARYRLTVRGTFFHDVEYEFKQRMKFAALLFRGLTVKKQRMRRSHPFLFPNSNLLFRDRTPSNGLVEMCVKSFFRDWAQFKVYIQFVLIGSGVLMLPFMPLWSKWLVWIAFAFIFSQRLKIYWGEMMASEFVRMFAWKDTDRMAAAGKAIFLLALPGFIIVSVAFGLSSFSLLGAIFIIPIGGVIAYGTSHMLAPW